MITAEEKVTRTMDRTKPTPAPQLIFRTTPAAQPGFTGLKIAVLLVFLLSLGALGASWMLSRTIKNQNLERSAAEAKVIQLQEQLEALKQGNSQNSIEIERLRGQLKTYTSENASLKKDLDQRDSEISNLRKKIRLLEDKNEKLERQSAPAPTPPETAVRPAVSQVSLPQAAVAASPAPASGTSSPLPSPVSSATPQVMTVNDKFNFVVINLGLQDQLKMGELLSVFRNGSVIGKIEVEKLYDRFAAATILQQDSANPIEKGDLIKRTGG